MPTSGIHTIPHTDSRRYYIWYLPFDSSCHHDTFPLLVKEETKQRAFSDRSGYWCNRGVEHFISHRNIHRYRYPFPCYLFLDGSDYDLCHRHRRIFRILSQTRSIRLMIRHTKNPMKLSSSDFFGHEPIYWI